jgi:hypothetical protein
MSRLLKSLTLTALLALGLPAAGLASEHTAPADGAVTSALKLLGSSRLKVLGFDIYDARLWAAQAPLGEDYARQAFTLELTYLRAFEGQAIVARSLREMRAIEYFSEAQQNDWQQALSRVIPDVRKGDRISGIYRPQEGIRFLLNGKLLGDVPDPALARIFMGIWLSPRTSEPAMRLALLGQAR